MTLTPRRRAILTAIWRSNGRSPSFRELMRAVGLTSKDSMFEQLHKLKRYGYVQFLPSQHRTLTLTGKGLLAAQGYELIYMCEEWE